MNCLEKLNIIKVDFDLMPINKISNQTVFLLSIYSYPIAFYYIYFIMIKCEAKNKHIE